MSDYVLSCCSTADVTRELLEERGIAYVYFNYQLDGQMLKDDFGQTNSPAQLYSKMLAGADAKTSQVSVGEYITHFEKFLTQGKDVLHVTLSSGISGTYGSACAARDQLAEKYPDRKIVIVDSLCASAGYGLLMDRLADLRDTGMGIDELAAWAEEHRLEVQHWFFSSDLTFFIRGGRISKAAGLVGGLLKICPVMDVEPNGSLAVKEKIRSKGRAIARDLQKMEELAQGGRNYTGKVFISQSECLVDAEELAHRIETTFPHIDGPVRIYPIGATIGCHTGPGTVALFFWGKPRE
ncbi:DegV family protein [Paratractidigestivibacter faecalis]|uniref:DegV family protein n=1 Tax=Paratractidigestivibacter faecalis TaxID=2292441 RepID=UPI00388F816F